ncbi:uncharacterized protein LOC103280789 [Anolis carolinensis]|uniref:uncharacterized protein LOC103280789 n=1 Tax=Anolis carolinensis TaxID=28377 RepID=UPI0004625DED|nr:PREDICTED: uncharacterized protein LOC103280789 [Anolis carolinensis]|eukprot:XP_008119040.1 PREDICTED: uncharacterized protein LOC103280789 [Anolis carolinensis]
MASNTMEPSQDLSLVPEVRLQQKYWIAEESKAKLLSAGAKCLGTVIQSEHYYDTASDELAMAELWLSQRNQQWSLIVGSQKQTTESVPKIWELPCFHANTQLTVHKDIDKIQIKLALLNNQNNHQHDSNEFRVNSTYTEIVKDSDIIAYLADFFNIDLEAEGGGNMGMEDFLRRAGIQHYATNHIVNQATYQLSNRYTIIIQRNEYSLKESATVLLDVDISNICKGLEDIEKLGNYLGFIQSEHAESDNMTTKSSSFQTRAN